MRVEQRTPNGFEKTVNQEREKAKEREIWSVQITRYRINGEEKNRKQKFCVVMECVFC